MPPHDSPYAQRTHESFAPPPARVKGQPAAPARGPLMRFEGPVTKAGRTIGVVDVRAFQHEPGSSERKLVSTMTATFVTVTGRDDVRH